MLEAEDLHDEIMDKIARTRKYIELNSTKQSGRVSPPVSQSSVDPQSQGIVTLPADQFSVTAQSVITQGVNESGLESVSTTTQNSDTLPVIPTAAELHNNSDTSITHHVSGPSPVTTTMFSNSFGPPPLIPAIYPYQSRCHKLLPPLLEPHRLRTDTITIYQKCIAIIDKF